MRNRSGRLFSFRGFGLVLVLVGVFPAAALAQSSDPRPTLPETNIYEQLTYEPENGVPVKKGWILFKSEWPKQPQLGEILYTPWGAPRMFWMCVDFPQLGNNGTICAYTDFFPYPPPPNVPEIPGTREWYCMWATNILIYSKPFNIGTCGWQNPSKGIREGSFKYTDQAGANGLQQALEAIDFMNSGSGDPGDTEP